MLPMFLQVKYKLNIKHSQKQIYTIMYKPPSLAMRSSGGGGRDILLGGWGSKS